MQPFTLNIKGKVYEYDHPLVMGILNITPDSFYAASRTTEEAAIRRRVSQMLEDGADIIDIGGYSSRPGSSDVDADEEMRRLERGINIIRQESSEVPISVDTFRASVARRAVKELSADIINDISGGNIDREMFATVADLRVPYILMHSIGLSTTEMHQPHQYNSCVADVITDLGKKVAELKLAGVCDIIIDPGFGFSKTLDQNYQMLKELDAFNVFGMPVLVGFSRKSMVTKLFGIDTEDSLVGTTVLNTLAMERGAAILRVHDVKAARQAVAIYTYTNTQTT